MDNKYISIEFTRRELVNLIVALKYTVSHAAPMGIPSNDFSSLCERLAESLSGAQSHDRKDWQQLYLNAYAEGRRLLMYAEDLDKLASHNQEGSPAVSAFQQSSAHMISSMFDKLFG